ncbi:hypothetical protein [Helcococcus massiliensis]|uniref:hypothetical protein n=1 Tax=Helcococcus massiliensis TaxID=2040290 RepID=UPI000CDEC1F7|nr:hypothetical protein [Helcococcus massiliensis]
MNNKKISRKNILPGFIFMIALSLLVYKITNILKPSGEINQYLKPSGDILKGVVEGNILDRLRWSIMDWTQGSFMGLLPASLGMLIFSYLGAYLERKNSKFMGTGIDGIGFIFTKISIAAFLASFLNLFVWSNFLANGWSVSFAPFLTTISYIMFYGTDWKKIITIIIFSVLLAFPLSHYAMIYITIPLNIPAYVAVAIGLICMVLITTLLFKFMPWMKRSSKSNNSNSIEKYTMKNENLFFIHRVFGDFGELNFWGSSYAGMAMILGSMLSLFLNIDHGSSSLDLLLASQLITATLSVFIYYHEWKTIGWSYTFGSILFTSAIVALYPINMLTLAITIVIGAIACPYTIKKVVQITKLGDTVPAIFFTLVGVGSLVTLWSFFLTAFILK